MLLHGLWNGLGAHGIDGLALAYAILACVLAGLVGVIIADRRRIVRLIWRFLPAYEATGLVTEADLRMLSTLRERHAARRWARLTGGRAAARAMEDYQLAATELALVHLRMQRGIISAEHFDAAPPRPAAADGHGAQRVLPPPAGTAAAALGPAGLVGIRLVRTRPAPAQLAARPGHRPRVATGPRSRVANISSRAAIQISTEPVTCTQTRPAGRPLKYWL